MKVSLNLNNLIIDHNYYGGNQDWYNSYIKRLAGCGPTTASTITMYELNKNNYKEYTKEEFIILMQELWNYITPGMRGVDTVSKYKDGYDKYLKTSNLELSKSKILILEDSSIDEVEDYLIEAINSDHPVAFLNLNNGSENQIDSWHWTTIVSIEKNDTDIYVNVCDEGLLKKVNLSNWIKTSNNGSFIYYYK